MSQRSRTSTSPRGYYNFDQPITSKRRQSIKIINDISSSPTSSSSSLSLSRPYGYTTVPVPYAPEPPSPNYARRRSPSFTRERRVIEAEIVTRSPDEYSIDTQAELAQYYRRQIQAQREPQRQLVEVARAPKPSSHRTKLLPPAPQRQERYELALVPVQYREQAVIVERSPREQPVVVERKQTIMMKDDQGRWCKVRKVVR